MDTLADVVVTLYVAVFIGLVGFGIGATIGYRIAARTPLRLRRHSSRELLSARQWAAVQLEQAAHELADARSSRDEAVRVMREREVCLLRRSRRLVSIDRELGRRGEETIVA